MTSFSSSSTRRIGWLLTFMTRSPPDVSSIQNLLPSPTRRHDADASAHPLDALAHDREPDPGAGIVFALVQPLEHAEHALVVRGVDADAVVLDPERVTPFSCSARTRSAGVRPGGTNFSPFATRFATDCTSATRCARTAGRSGATVHRAARCGDVALDLRERVVHHVAEAHARELHVAAAHAAVREQVLNQRVHPARAGDDALRVVLADVVELRAAILEQRLAEPVHRAQRRAQVVRDRVAEGLELLVALAQLLGALAHLVLQALLRLLHAPRHRVERARQFAELVLARDRPRWSSRPPRALMRRP